MIGIAILMMNELSKYNDLLSDKKQVIAALKEAADNAEKVAVRDALLEAFPKAEIGISCLGVVIGAHCGPGLFTIFYMTDERRPK